MGNNFQKIESIKVAVQFFGHLRTYVRCAKSIKKHLLDLYDCDVFVHTWTELDCLHSTLRCAANKKRETHAERALTENDVKRVHQLFSPKVLEISNPKDVNASSDERYIPCLINRNRKEFSTYGVSRMIYSKMRVNTLRKNYQEEHGKRYDYVIMLRADVRLNKDFILEQLHKEIQQASLPPARYYAINPGSSPMIGDLMSDIIYMGSPDIIDRTLEVWSKVDFSQLQRKVWTPEKLLSTVLEEQGIHNQAINYSYGSCWEIVRLRRQLSLRQSILRIRVSDGTCRIYLFNSLPCSLFKVKVHLFGFLGLEFYLGKALP